MPAALAAIALFLAPLALIELASDWRKLRRGRFSAAPGWMRRYNDRLIHGRRRTA